MFLGKFNNFQTRGGSNEIFEETPDYISLTKFIIENYNNKLANIRKNVKHTSRLFYWNIYNEKSRVRKLYVQEIANVEGERKTRNAGQVCLIVLYFKAPGSRVYSVTTNDPSSIPRAIHKNSSQLRTKFHGRKCTRYL